MSKFVFSKKNFGMAESELLNDIKKVAPEVYKVTIREFPDGTTIMIFFKYNGIEYYAQVSRDGKYTWTDSFDEEARKLPDLVSRKYENLVKSYYNKVNFSKKNFSRSPAPGFKKFDDAGKLSDASLNLKGWNILEVNGNNLDSVLEKVAREYNTYYSPSDNCILMPFYDPYNAKDGFGFDDERDQAMLDEIEQRCGVRLGNLEDLGY